MMKTAITALIVSFGLTGCVNAQSQESFTFVRILDSQPNYVVQNINVPQTQCFNVNVPVYGQQYSNGADVLGGMIIGGAIGNVIGGNDKSTALGAVLGGVIAAEPRQRIIGHQYQQKCETVFVQKQQQVIDGYFVTYNHQNQNGTVHSPVFYQPGSLVSVRDLITGGRKSF
jgi:uncharacterized protein YcfJ